MTTNLSALYGSGGGSGRWKSQIFNYSGVWEKPQNVEVVKVLLVGGGGGGSNDPTNAGSPGGNSIFNVPSMPVIARGGEGGSIMHGGSGGGSTYIRMQIWYNISIYSGLSTAPYFDTIFGNGAYVAGSINWSGGSGIPRQWGGPGESGGFGSMSGGGGGAIYPFGPHYGSISNGVLRTIFPGGLEAKGGSVPGFGTRGTCALLPNFYGSGGGASFGDGRSVNVPESGGYGGGGFAEYANGAWGGGGGEITIREVPVSSSVVVTVGSGGSGRSLSGTGKIASAGMDGLCIVYWQG